MNTIIPSQPERPSLDGHKTLNDAVQAVVLHLWDDPKFQRYLQAKTNAEAVEGSMFADHCEAAQQIQRFGDKNNVAIVAGTKITPIVTALRVVLRRLASIQKQSV